jgi:sulfur-oxidizing protein SoxX
MNRSRVSLRGTVVETAAALVSLGSVLLTGCAAPTGGGRVSLPMGDSEAGKVAFGDLMCYTCHQVAGPAAAFPAPTASPPVPVELGAEAVSPTRDQWVMSIIDPSHEIAPGYREELVAEGKLSRMGDYSHLLTVRQLADLVAFLESLHTRSQAMD